MVANAWIISSFGGLVNALGRVGTGLSSDKIGRANAYTLNCLVSALCLFLLPGIIASRASCMLILGGRPRLLAVRWRSGPHADLHRRLLRPRNLGMNYGLVFIGWGLGFFMTRLAGTI